MLEELFNELYGLNGRVYDYEDSKVMADVIENEGGYLVTADLPGVNKEDIKISFEKGYLTIEASRKNPENVKYYLNERPMHFKKTIYFNDELDGEEVKAKYENGILAVTLKKSTKSAKSIMIE